MYHSSPQKPVWKNVNIQLFSFYLGYIVSFMFMFKHRKVRSNTENSSDSEQAADAADIGAPAAGSCAAVPRSVRLTWSAH